MGVYAQRHFDNIRFVAGSKTASTTSFDGVSGATTETTDWITLGDRPYNEVIIEPNFSVIDTAHANDEIDFYLQTTLSPTNAVPYDLLNIHFATGDDGTTHRQPRIWRGGELGGFRALAVTDGSLADDETQLGVPLGTHVRIKLVTTIGGTPSVTYTCPLTVRYNPGAPAAIPIGKGINDNGVTTTIKRAAIEISAASGAQEVVTAVTAKKIRLLGYNVVTDTASALTWQDDTGTPVVLVGASTFAASGGASVYPPAGAYPGQRFLGETASGKALDLNVGTSATVGGSIEYLEI